METIASFEIDHTTLRPGLYLSRVDGGVRTYDLRFTLPNKTFLPSPVLHTIEHLFAVFARNGFWREKILYFGPMGCRTGFYLLTTSLCEEEILPLVRQTMEQIAYYRGEIPGATEVECGNWREHDLSGARVAAKGYLTVLAEWSCEKLVY